MEQNTAHLTQPGDEPHAWAKREEADDSRRSGDKGRRAMENSPVGRRSDRTGCVHRAGEKQWSAQLQQASRTWRRHSGAMAALSRQPSRRALTHQLWVHDPNQSQGAFDEQMCLVVDCWRRATSRSLMSTDACSVMHYLLFVDVWAKTFR